MIQGSPEWFEARCGKLTASRLADAITKTRNGYAASRATYAAELIAERLTSRAADHYTSPAMAWGTEHEPAARAAYQFFHGVTVHKVGFVDHPRLAMAGASPDGLVGSDGLVEIKAPTTKTHVETLMGAPIPEGYRAQIQWQLACTNRAWCDFASYDPRMPESMRLFVKRVARDDKWISELETEASEFLQEVADKVLLLRSTYEMAA